jgi:hypothetical protein
MLSNHSFRLRTIVRFLTSVGLIGPSQPSSAAQRRSDRPNGPEPVAAAKSEAREEKVSTGVSFWNCHGTYIGYRASDELFDMNGRQIGYFAEGNEVYGCNGRYLGEVRGQDRLITNPKKQAWARPASVPRALQHSAGRRDQPPVEVRPGYEDFPVAS